MKRCRPFVGVSLLPGGLRNGWLVRFGESLACHIVRHMIGGR